MSVPNGDRTVTKQDLADFYNDIRPYMGGIVTSKAGFTPIGTIISVMGTTAPVNYLACDGTVYNIADYTELANYFNEQFGSKNFFGGDGTTTFAVPDLRGEFLRGTGTNSHENQGNGASVGVHQDGTVHLGQMVQSTGRFYQGCPVSGTKYFDGEDSSQNVDSHFSVFEKNFGYYDGTIYNNNDYNCYTSRPTNTSVLYCIATKNFYIDPTLDYSTEEKIVGTWIDGKPVYQKYYPSQLTLSLDVWVDTGISKGSISKIISVEAYTDNGTAINSVASSCDGTNIKICSSVGATLYDVHGFTLRYIKTT